MLHKTKKYMDCRQDLNSKNDPKIVFFAKNGQFDESQNSSHASGRTSTDSPSPVFPHLFVEID